MTVFGREPASARRCYGDLCGCQGVVGCYDEMRDVAMNGVENYREKQCGSGLSSKVQFPIDGCKL